MTTFLLILLWLAFPVIVGVFSVRAVRKAKRVRAEELALHCARKADLETRIQLIDEQIRRNKLVSRPISEMP